MGGTRADGALRAPAPDALLVDVDDAAGHAHRPAAAGHAHRRRQLLDLRRVLPLRHRAEKMLRTRVSG